MQPAAQIWSREEKTERATRGYLIASNTEQIKLASVCAEVWFDEWTQQSLKGHRFLLYLLS